MFKGLKGLSLYSLTKKLLAIFILGLFAFSCVQNQGTSTRRKSNQGASTDNTNPTPETPVFEGQANFLQNGSTKSTTTLTLAGDFATSLYLRGAQVDQFIKIENKNNVQCLLIPHTNTAIQKTLILAAFPRFFFNFTTNAQEYYYEVEPANTSNNATFCQQPGVLSTIGSDFVGTTPVYQLSDVCPNCSLSIILSDSLKLLTASGLSIPEVTLINLRIELRPETTVDVPSNLSCNTSSECQSKGFDCCSFGQCVKDKQVRSSVDQSSIDFQQALLDIQDNPGAVTNYPEFFHLCATNIPGDPDPTPRPDPAVGASERFLERKALFDCTTPTEGEMAICEEKYIDVQKTITNTGSNQFTTGADDRNFNTNYSGTSTLLPHSIFQVDYAGETLFTNGAIVKGMTIGPGGNNTGNDNLDDPQVINLTATPAASADNDNLTIKYKIDGSCKQISTFIAQCFKVYVQGENKGKVTDHFPASNEFLLPYYADANKTITVTVDDAQSLQFTNWNLIQTTPARIEFTGSSLAVFDTQVVKITFFVNLQNYQNVLLKKKAAKDTIKTICACGTLDCSLVPVEDSTGNVVDFKCFYPPPPLPPPPLQQTVLISAKTAPHRFYDKDGVYHESAEDSLTEQEGPEFLYTGSNLLRPNNVDNYIGFNEIYGSFTKKTSTALPAKEVRVVVGKTYDIFTDSGSYSSCFFCGTDYFSSLARIFPQNFLSNGGGYTPDLKENDPLATKNFRRDDLLFGRACFVPATMIPWTHATESSRSDQRQKRLAAQHFLFANGYQRDWYGFDYGSVIGSFDGVRWFSIGNQRRIQARSTKLFIAINSYYADFTDNTTFSVTVQDTSTVSGLGSFVTSDFVSDGAECQKEHVCETDSDCASKLGWDYSCESITNLSSSWPRFDSNGLEVPGVSDVVNLRNLFGQTTGSTKRCVYRGRGSMCNQDYTTSDTGTNYSGTAQPGLHACSNNNYCQPFIEGVAVTKFNNKIARFGKSVKAQNASDLVSESDLDTIGLGARIIGRPYAWRGTDSIPTDAQTNLSQNNVTSLCIPGRDNNDDNFLSNHSSIPNSEALGDQFNGIGVTPSLTDGDGSRLDYLSRCSIFDDGNNYLFKSTAERNSTLSSSSISKLAARQALSTNLLDIFESDLMTGNEIIKNYEDEFIDEIVLQENRCLRAPGSTCFSALDCAPNSFIADQVANLNIEDPNVTDNINRYEIKFWQEELVCAQDKVPGATDFDLGQNRCCRESDKILTIGTSLVNSDGTSGRDLDFRNIPGVTTDINSTTRNSRLSTVWDLIQTSDPKYPRLRSVRTDACGTGACGDPDILDNQFNTFSEIATRTCCSKNWIRNFDKEENGGGHTWGPNKTQQIPKETFRCYNYAPCVDGPDGDPTDSCGDDPGDGFIGFTCSHTDEPDDPNCRARQITDPEAKVIFDWMETFELTGIAQVAIKGVDHPDITCKADPNDQSASIIGLQGPSGLINSTPPVKEYSDLKLSADDMTNFDSTIKKVFSKDQVTCCLPAGTQMPSGANPSDCCTGFIGSAGSCQLPPYTDVSLYLNRYVSSEAQGEDVSAFDAKTGYLTSPFDVIRIACKKKLCESGSLVEGVALSNLRTRGHENNDKQKFRFLDGDDESNTRDGFAELYDRGLKWNTHYYCNDPDLTTPIPGTINCSDF
ncbi:MAG: hypothetical protein K9K67_12375 [Bacteriovoracaceae bacterium]|nr:hypothetical protein [Bacteriovoracaceae bacterium]